MENDVPNLAGPDGGAMNRTMRTQFTIGQGVAGDGEDSEWDR